MKIGIMQPYFFPYIGYFQLMKYVNEFIVYDNIQYTKRGWINRNRILSNGRDEYVTLPLKNDSDFLNVDQRFLSENWKRDKEKLLNRIRGSYGKAPNFHSIFSLVEECFNFENTNLFEFVHYSLHLISSYLGIETPIIVSSSIPIDHQLKAEERVIEICKSRLADDYVNPIGGTELYDKSFFKTKGINLYFHQVNEIKYKQYDNDFIPNLSIVDLMMFNNKNEIKEMLNTQFK